MAETTLLTAARQHLAADAGVAAKVSTRVFTEVAPPDCPRPFIVLLEVDAVPVQASGQAAGVREARLEVSVVADSALAALQTGVVVDQLLDGFQGTWDDGGTAVRIDACLADDSRQWYDAETKARVRQQDYLVTHAADQ